MDEGFLLRPDFVGIVRLANRTEAGLFTGDYPTDFEGHLASRSGWGTYADGPAPMSRGPPHASELASVTDAKGFKIERTALRMLTYE